MEISCFYRDKEASRFGCSVFLFDIYVICVWFYSFVFKLSLGESRKTNRKRILDELWEGGRFLSRCRNGERKGVSWLERKYNEKIWWGRLKFLGVQLSGQVLFLLFMALLLLYCLWLISGVDSDLFVRGKQWITGFFSTVYFCFLGLTVVSSGID